MQALMMLLLAVSANVDNFTIAMAYGLRRERIDWRYNLLISLVAGLGTYLSMLFGHLLSDWLTPRLATDIGALLLIVIGCWFWLEEWHKLRQGMRRGRETRYLRWLKRYMRGEQSMSLKEALLLSVMLSVNNLGGGIGASLMGYPAQVTAVIVGCLSLGAIVLGQYLGERSAAQSLGRYSAWIAGGILVLLGLSEIFR